MVIIQLGMRKDFNMKIDINENFKWFLESLLNEGFDGFFIDDMYGAIFTKNSKVTSIDTANFITSNFYKACSDLEENIEYSIKDFIEGKLDDKNFKFGDKVIIRLNCEEFNGIFIRKSNKNNVVATEESKGLLLISNKNIRKAD